MRAQLCPVPCPARGSCWGWSIHERWVSSVLEPGEGLWLQLVPGNREMLAGSRSGVRCLLPGYLTLGAVQGVLGPHTSSPPCLEPPPRFCWSWGSGGPRSCGGRACPTSGSGPAFPRLPSHTTWLNPQICKAFILCLPLLQDFPSFGVQGGFGVSE